MCAINGFSFEDGSLGEKMGEATKHRGPDASGVFSGRVTLQHNRLSIIDCDPRSNQPFTSPDGRYVLVYNGEIYNFKDLRKELSYECRTGSDTEVLLAAFLKWGKDCVSHLNGMYAFVIWDTKENELFIARDPRGIKPLYYYFEDGKFIFSSEIRGILAHGVEKVLDQEAMMHFFRLLYVPEPFTLFKGIRKFPHGHTGVFKDGKLVVEKFEVGDFGISVGGSQKERAAQLREVVGGAVSRQLVADVPVGMYLSGGIDSTMVLDRAVKGGVKPKTFSTSFDIKKVSNDTKFNDDASLAEKTAAFYGVEHETVGLSMDEIFEAMVPAMRSLEEPNANPTFIPMYLLAKKVVGDVKVVLTGTGGDELFGGYERYTLSRRLSSVEGLMPLLKVLAPKYAVFSGIDRYARFMFQKDKDLIGVPHDSSTYDLYAKKFTGEGVFEEELMRVDQDTWLIDDALLRGDKMSMAHGLEVRVPLLDEAVIQFAHQLPIEDKVSLFGTKILPKIAFKEEFPEHIFGQPKRGWFTPSAKWLREEQFTKFAREVLSPSYYAGTADLFDFDAIAVALEDHLSMKGYHRTLLWSLISFQVWAKEQGIRV